MLESQLTASIIACEGEANENKRLRNYVEPLESELDNKIKIEKKTEKRNKASDEWKWQTTEIIVEI